MIQEFARYYEEIKKTCSSKQFLIYGTGQAAKDFISFLKEQGIWGGLVGFVESKPSIDRFENLPVYSADNVVNLALPIMIASSYCAEIADHLESIGVYDFYNVTTIRTSKTGFCDDILVKLRNLNDRLEDEKSKLVLDSLLAFIMSSNRTPIILSDYPQYKHPNIDLSNLIFVDGGGCIGGNIDLLAEALRANGNAFIFEPDLNNIEKITNKVLSLSLDNAVTIEPEGLWASSTVLTFQSEAITGSNRSGKVADSGDTKVFLRSLDEYFKHSRLIPSYIKMDIEGAEYQALLGAKALISHHKPQLAICLYHYFDDLWRLPELIDQLNPNYKMVMGHHHKSWWETVLYCY